MNMIEKLEVTLKELENVKVNLRSQRIKTEGNDISLYKNIEYHIENNKYIIDDQNFKEIQQSINFIGQNNIESSPEGFTYLNKYYGSTGPGQEPSEIEPEGFNEHYMAFTYIFKENDNIKIVIKHENIVNCDLTKEINKNMFEIKKNKMMLNLCINIKIISQNPKSIPFIEFLEDLLQDYLTSVKLNPDNQDFIFIKTFVDKLLLKFGPSVNKGTDKIYTRNVNEEGTIN